MNVINLSHGGFYLLGGYIGLSMIRQWGIFWPALLLAPLLVALLAAGIERFLLRRLYGEQHHLRQVLLTFGIALILSDLIQWNWGGYVASVSPPAVLAGQIPFFEIQFLVYRLATSLLGR